MKKNDKSILGYKQAPGTETWQVLRPLSREKVEQETRPEELGRMDGSQNIPPAHSVDLAETENQILYLAEEHLVTINDQANKEMTDIEHQLNARVIEQEDTFADLMAKADKEFQHYLLQVYPDLQRLRIEEHQQLRYYKLFKANHGLNRLASYPESRWMHFGIIALTVFLECVANMYFFAAASEIGLLGGFFQALLISVGNVGLSLLVGWIALSNLHHTNKMRKAAGIMGFSVWILIITTYHLLVAHYRDMLAVDPEGAMAGAVAKFATSPLQLQTLDSVLVMVIGGIISIIALIDGYKIDDPYPGFGAEDRLYKTKRLAYEAKEAEVRGKLAAGLSEVETQVDERLRGYADRARMTGDLFSGLTSVVEHFSNVYAQVDDVVASAINKYRDANRKIRTEAEPRTFATIPQPRRVLELDKFHAQYQRLFETKKASDRMLQNIREHAAQVKVALANKANTMLERIDGLANDISMRADKDLAQFNQEA